MVLVIEAPKQPEAAVPRQKPIRVQDSSQVVSSRAPTRPEKQTGLPEVLLSSRGSVVASRQRSRGFVVYGQNKTFESLVQSSTDSIANKESLFSRLPITMTDSRPKNPLAEVSFSDDAL